MKTIESSLLEAPVDLHTSASEEAVGTKVLAYYLEAFREHQQKALKKAETIQERQDRIRLINETLAAINAATTSEHKLDLEKHPELIEKLATLRGLGLSLSEKKSFDAVERDRLIEGLHLSLDSSDRENRTDMQKLEQFLRELDRILTLAKTLDDKENQVRKAISNGIGGR